MNTLEPIVINTSEISLTMSCEDICEALRFCAIEKKCTRCTLFSITDCDAVLMPAVFEMIKRQKSEIERLREVNINICETGGKLLRERKTIRNATIKELEEKLKSHKRRMCGNDNGGLYWDQAVLVDDIDRALKAMTEGEA